jgi:O-antigen/teichoic acid export membrane protein
MPLAIFGNGIIQISQSFFTKSKQFITISSSKIIHSMVGSLAQILTGFVGLNFIGLIIGRVAGLISADLNYISQFLKSYKWPKRNKEKENSLIRKHKKFIQYTSPGFFVGNSINLIILILFTHFYGEKFTGLTAAAIQYLGLIIMLFASSFSQVYYNEIAQISDPKKLISSFTFWIKRLAVISIAGWLILFFIPSSVIIYILGEKWSGLLDIIKIISPWMGIMFIASSLSYVFIRLGRQKEILIFDIIHLFLIISGLYLGHYLFNNKILTLYIITFLQTIFYIGSLLIAYWFLIKNLKHEEV